MGFLDASLLLTTNLTMTGAIPAPGSAVANTQDDPAAGVRGSVTQALTFGGGTGNLNAPCGGEYTIAAGASLTLNLYDGGATVDDLTTLLGAPANLRGAKGLTVGVISGGDSAGVTVGGAASDAWAGFWSGTFDVFPGGPAAALGSPGGAPVTSSAKNLKLLNNGSAPVTLQVFVPGTTVAPGFWTGFWGFLTY